MIESLYFQYGDFFHKYIKGIMRKLSKITESIWSDIQDRSMGKTVRKEDQWKMDLIKEFIERHHLEEKDYHINSDFSLDIHRNIMVKPFDLVDRKLPFKFGKIDGTIWLSDLNLDTLENSPSEVTGDFVIDENKIKDFTGGPEIVGGNFSANLNYSLESLDGSPKEVGGNYSILGCRYIKDIKGISPKIGGDLKLTNKPFLVFADFEYRKYSNIKGKIIKK